MSTVKEIEDAISQLSPAEMRTLREWFAHYDGILWDQQIENDAGNGRLDALAEEALEDLRSGRSTDL